jgi:predicted HicB family RNase H-like nuclease
MIPETKTRVTIIIDKNLKAELKELAKKDKRSLSSYIDTVLTKHVKNQ